jgi:hypothetical protein
MGKNEDSSPSEEEAEGEDARERSLCGIWKGESETGTRQSVFPKHKTPIKWTPLRGVR